MNRKLIVPAVAAIAISLLPIAKSYSEGLNLKLLPSPLIQTAQMADPDIFQNEVSLRNPSNLFGTPLKDLPVDASVAANLPLIGISYSNEKAASRIPDTTADSRPRSYGLSSEIISSTFSVGEKVEFQRSGMVNYLTKFGVLINSPALDDRVSGGNHLYLGFGITGENSGKLEDLSRESISEILSSAMKNRGWSADVYIVPKTYNGQQLIAIRGGIESTPSKEFLVNLSSSFRFPVTDNFAPYTSIDFRINPNDTEKTKVLAQAGIETGNILTYIGTEYQNNIWALTAGIKLK